MHQEFIETWIFYQNSLKSVCCGEQVNAHPENTIFLEQIFHHSLRSQALHFEIPFLLLILGVTLNYHDHHHPKNFIFFFTLKMLLSFPIKFLMLCRCAQT